MHMVFVCISQFVFFNRRQHHENGFNHTSLYNYYSVRPSPHYLFAVITVWGLFFIVSLQLLRCEAFSSRSLFNYYGVRPSPHYFFFFLSSIITVSGFLLIISFSIMTVGGQFHGNVQCFYLYLSFYYDNMKTTNFHIIQ